MSVRRISPSMIFNQLKTVTLDVLGDSSYSYIYAGSGVTSPNLRYNKLTSKWQFSNNGVTWADMGTGGTAGDDAITVVEFVVTEIPTETNHQLPSPHTYVLATGNKLNVYLNGQLLTHDQDGTQYDYVEVNINTIKFHFNVPQGTTLLYIIKQ